MERLMSRLLRNQSGQGVLVMILILLVLGTLIMGPLLGFMDTGLKAGQTHEELSSRLYAADSGVDDSIHWIVMGKQTEDWPWTGNGTVGWQRDTYMMNESSVNVTVDDLGGNEYIITSRATSADGSTTVLCTVWAISVIEGFNPPQGSRYEGDVYVDGDVDTGTHVEIIGNVSATGDINLSNHSNITGTVSVLGDITLDSHAAVSGNICASGNVTVWNGATVTGDLYVTANSTITLVGGEHEEARIEGDIHGDGNIAIVARNTATIEGNIYITGNLSVALEQPHSRIVGDVYATGDIDIPADQAEERVTGNITANYTGEYPDPPNCPLWDVGGPDILTYQIT